MRTFALLSIIAFSAQVLSAELRPTKCLFQNAAGQVKEEVCTPRVKDSKVNLAGVCLYDKGWKRGSWYPGKSGDARFVAKRICTEGVEVTEIEEATSIKGPKIVGSKEVSSGGAGKFQGPATAVTSSSYPSELPYTCYTNINEKTGISNSPVDCGTSDEMKNQCLYKKLYDQKYGGKIYSGYWWVVYPDPSKDAHKICTGGVLMGKPAAGDRISKRLLPTDFNNLQLADNEKISTCIIKQNFKGRELTYPKFCQNNCIAQKGKNPFRLIDSTLNQIRLLGGGCCVKAYNENNQLNWAIQTAELKSDVINKLTSGDEDQIKSLSINSSLAKCEELVVTKDVVED